MNIYSNSRYSSTESLFDSLIGKDAWVQICVTTISGSPSGWVQILSKNSNYFGTGGYDVYWVDSDYVGDDGVCRCTIEDFEDFTSYQGFIIPDDVEILKPIDILSTEEFFEFE